LAVPHFQSFRNPLVSDIRPPLQEDCDGNLAGIAFAEFRFSFVLAAFDLKKPLPA
jgi:hypothetical protein